MIGKKNNNAPANPTLLALSGAWPEKIAISKWENEGKMMFDRFNHDIFLGPNFSDIFANETLVLILSLLEIRCFLSMVSWVQVKIIQTTNVCYNIYS